MKKLKAEITTYTCTHKKSLSFEKYIEATMILSSSSLSHAVWCFSRKDSSHPINVAVMWALFQEPDGSANFKPNVLASNFERYFVFLFTWQYSWKSALRISTLLSTEVPPVRYCIRATEQAIQFFPKPIWTVCQMSIRWKRWAPPTDSSCSKDVQGGSRLHGGGVSKTLASCMPDQTSGHFPFTAWRRNIGFTKMIYFLSLSYGGGQIRKR